MMAAFVLVTFVLIPATSLTNRDGPTTCKCTIIPVGLEFNVNFDA